MASNTDDLQNLSDERRKAAEPTPDGVYPIGGSPVPDANTSIENTAAIDSGDAPTAGDPAPDAAVVPTVDAESPTARRGTSSKAAPAKS